VSWGGILFLLLLAMLAGCTEEASTSAPATATPVPAACPQTLAYVKDRLATPYPELEKFIGKEALDATFTKPIDQMIAAGGGIDASIAGGEEHVQEYENILKNEKAVRAEYEKDGMSDSWIDTYFLSVLDGVTLNQAFVDAVKCRKAGLQEQSKAAPAN
jgi:hypothetical protein